MIEHIEHFDAIVIGAGISGETCAHRLRMGGMRVALVEREYIGGECAYWATLPTATLMGPANARWRAQALAGIASPALASPRSLTTSDILFSSLDEVAQVAAIEKEGGTFIRGEAHFTGRGQIEVGTRRLEAPHIVIATGSEPAIPPIPGLSEVGYWTNREATTATAIPQRVVILGGEAQAVEIGQMFRLYGAEVTLITRRDHLLATENSEIGKLLAQRLRRQGMRVLVKRSVVRIWRDEEQAFVVTLDDDNTEIHAQALVVATRRYPRTRDLQLENAGIQAGIQSGGAAGGAAIVVNETCRAADGVWAIGAVTSSGQLSHLAQYQARLAADDILGHPHPAHYGSVPRVFYTDPQIAVTGWTKSPANGKKQEEIAEIAEVAATAIVSVAVDLREHKSQPAAVGRAERGKLTLIADASRGTLVGAWAAATDAGEWIQLAALAIRAHLPLDELRDTLEQFPPFGEVYLSAVDRLIAAIAQHKGQVKGQVKANSST